jgi:GNAT superfamily N-acetyltransferase
VSERHGNGAAAALEPAAAAGIETRLGTITLAPLRDGDVQTVRAVVERLGARSRHRRFGKLELRPSDLAFLARVGSGRHVLVARAGQQPVALAHLVRHDDPSSAEVAVAIGDEWQGSGIGTALARRLAADAAAAGISRLHALIGGENRAALALMAATTRIVTRQFEGADVYVVGEVGEPRRPTCSTRSKAGSTGPPASSCSRGGSPSRTRATPPPRRRRQATTNPKE